MSNETKTNDNGNDDDEAATGACYIYEVLNEPPNCYGGLTKKDCASLGEKFGVQWEWKKGASCS